MPSPATNTPIIEGTKKVTGRPGLGAGRVVVEVRMPRAGHPVLVALLLLALAVRP